MLRPLASLTTATLALLSLAACADAQVTEPSPVDAVASMVAAINTTVDPAFEYEYVQSRFVPPPGETLLVMGQTLQAIDAYVEAFPDRPAPGGWAAYWGIPNTDGLWNTATNEFGDRHNHQQLVERFPNSVLQSALWMVGTWDVAGRTARGEFDQVIRDFSEWAKTVPAPIYLRIGYEFDGPHNELEPSQYVTAYRRIVDIIRSEGVENVAFVWHSYGSPPYRGYPLSAWYPGTEYVDWVGISLFGHMYAPEPGEAADSVFEFARVERKPVMIAEASPINGIWPGNEAWESWFVNFLSLAYRRNVKAISLINADWRDHSVAASLNWKDARLQRDSLVAEAWFTETAKGRYLKASPELFQRIGFPER